VENTTRRKNMKKILAILLMVSVVAGMTLPAMAKTEAVSTSSGGANTKNIDVDLDGSNYAAHTVAVTLNVGSQNNNLHDVLAASGDNTNGAVSTLAASAKAEDATSGTAASGSSGSGAATTGGAGASVDKVKANDDSSASADPEAETGNAKSESETGDASTGDATNVAKVSGNENQADANGNHLKSGNADNDVKQLNIIKQITPVYISNDQKLVQKVIIPSSDYQDASSNPVTVAKSTDKKTEITKTDTDIKTTDIDTNIDKSINFDDSPIKVSLDE
jgi:hypothetical protein